MNSDSDNDRGAEPGHPPAQVLQSGQELGLRGVVRHLDALQPSGRSDIESVSERDRRRLVANLLSYAAVPDATGLSPDLLAAFDPHAPRVRALRYLAGRLIQEAATSEGLCFSVAAPHRRAGASFLAANLGVVYSQIGLRTVLVDANIRAPRLHRIFGCPDGVGVSDLQDSVGGTGPTIPVERLRRFHDLSLVPGGKPRDRRAPARLGTTLADMVADLRKAFDVVICDAPAFAGGRTDDCQVVAGICGEAVVVLRKDHTPVRRTQALLSSLAAARINVVGSTLLSY